MDNLESEDLKSPTLLINRSACCEEDLAIYRRKDRNIPLCKKIQLKFKNFINRKKHNFTFLSFFESFFPIIFWLRTYNWKVYFKFDFFSGLTIGIMQISQGLAYGTLAGLEPVTGLYVSFIPGLIYSIFGTSNYLHIGTFALISIMVSNTLNSGIAVEYASNHFKINPSTGLSENITELEAKYIISATLTICVGLIQFFLFFIHAGLISRFLSPTMVNAYTFGASIHVFTTQFGTLLGIPVPSSVSSGTVGIVVKRYVYIFSHITSANVAAIVVSLISLTYLLIFMNFKSKIDKALHFPLPTDIFLIIISTGITFGLRLDEKYSLPIVGTIPKGLPTLLLPDFSIFLQILPNAFIISIVTYAIAISISQDIITKVPHEKFALSNKIKLSPNQELLAYGIINIFSGFFKCYVAGSSLARTVIQSNLGYTQMFSIISAIFILIVLMAASSLFTYLPLAVLSSIIIVALISVFKKIVILKFYWQYYKAEFFIWIITACSVVFIGIEYGLLIGVLVSIIPFFLHFFNGNFNQIGSLKNIDIYKNNKYFDVKIDYNCLILSYNSPLLYINCDYFVSYLTNCINNFETITTDHVETDLGVELLCQQNQSLLHKRFIILNMSNVSFIDMAGVDSLTKILNLSKDKSVNIYFSNVNSEIIDILKRCDENFTLISYPTIYDATFINK